MRGINLSPGYREVGRQRDVVSTDINDPCAEPQGLWPPAVRSGGRAGRGAEENGASSEVMKRRRRRKVDQKPGALSMSEM